MKNPQAAEQGHLESCGYYMLFEQATDPIMVTDFKGNFIDVNPSLCSLLSCSKKELVGTNVTAFIDPQDLIEKPIPFNQLAQGINTFTERKVLLKNGNIVYLDSNAKKCGDDRILVIARNITERKKAESILLKSEANLKTIFDNTDTIYVLLDKDFRIISYNTRAQSFARKEFGREIDVNAYFLDYFSEDRRPLLLNYMKEVITGRHINYSVSYPQEGNLRTWYNVRMFPISDGDTKVYGLMLAVSDTTEKTLLEEKLEEERNKRQQEITDAVITAEENERHQIGQELHDNVNQLLATAKLYIGMAQKTATTKDLPILTEADKFIDTALNEIRNLSHSLISPFLDEYGLLEALDYLTRSISKAGKLPIHTEIEIDEHRLEQKLKLTIYRIIQEQLNNILKYAKATSVKITLVQSNSSIILNIKDDGAGFDTGKTYKGMGLMNIRTRASLLNGKVHIISSPGKGCELKINFDTASTN